MRQLAPQRLVNVSALPTASPALKGAQVYLTTDDRIYVCNGVAWAAMAAATKSFTPSGVYSGDPVTVPLREQWIVWAKPFLVEDDLTLEGDLVLLQ